MTLVGHHSAPERTFAPLHLPELIIVLQTSCLPVVWAQAFVRFHFDHLFSAVTQEAIRFLMLIFKRSSW